MRSKDELRRAAPFGLLNVNKPAGVTSRDVVNRVQWLLKQRAKAEGTKPAKVGHAGTLDPIATGVLVLCLGSATKLIEHVQRQPKRYRGTFLLGRRSPSDDVELAAEELIDPPIPTRTRIQEAMPSFIGRIQQIPPAYSAIKIGGKKAYDLARAGQAPEMKPRSVTIHDLTIASYDYPELVLDIRCGSGTYVRALGRDLAESLGTAAVMSALERTEIGPMKVDDAIAFEAIEDKSIHTHLLPAALAVADLPSIRVTPDEVEELRNGRFLPREAPSTGEHAAVTAEGELVALVTPANGSLRPVRNLL